MKSALARQICEERGLPVVSFPFLGEMQLEPMREQDESDFFSEVLRENDLEGEGLEMLAPGHAYYLDMMGTETLG